MSLWNRKDEDAHERIDQQGDRIYELMRQVGILMQRVEELDARTYIHLEQTQGPATELPSVQVNEAIGLIAEACNLIMEVTPPSDGTVRMVKINGSR